MAYIVIELQTWDQTAYLVTQHDTKNDAESKYHQVLAAAAVSAVPVHSAVMLTDEGIWLRSECYKHPAQQAEPEPEEE